MENNEKILLVVAGPNGSGKSSSISNTNIYRQKNMLIINPDNYVKHIKWIEDITEKYKFAMDSFESLRNTFLENGISFGFETVASTEEKITFVKKAKAVGYQIHLIFVNAGTPEKCYERVKMRVARGGHDVPKEKIFSRYERTLSFLHQYIQLADVAKIYDNSTDHLEMVLLKENGTIKITDYGKECEWVKKSIIPYFKQ